jgi:asparagine synthase (glutamine-hydrolysing)
MCGIAGIVGKIADEENIQQILNKMAEVIDHRGPDDEGFHYGPGIGLAFRRLSIIDLKTGHQPIYNEDKSKVIILNGEIYNYRELRPVLIQQGHIFTTHTDTEVILHSYEQKGEQCLQDFNGMFAFCIWDGQTKTAFIARDRLGKKPLYYARIEDTLIFSSEIKSILKSGYIKPEISYETVNHYLTYRFCPAPHTPFKNIHKLPPAHYLIFRDGKLEIRRYWQIRNFVKVASSESYIKQQILEKLRLAVQRRLVSDVPLGLFLSGGIDSSAVLAIMSEQTEEPVKTFSIGFDFGKEYQEFEYANQAAQLFKSDHHTMILTAREFLNEIPALVWYLDEPVADSAVIPLYFISRLAKKYITVALSGEGSDEIFAGYARLYEYDYNRHKRKKLLQRLPAFTRGRGMKYIFENYLSKYREKFEFVRNPIESDRITSMGDYFSTRQKEELFRPHIYKTILTRDSYSIIAECLREYPGIGYLDRKLLIDLLYWLPDDLLTKADRASMANAIELRVPFLDHELVEYTFRIRDELKIRGTEGKVILKKALQSIIPGEIIYRKKMGFPVPLSEWFAGELKTQVHEILLGERAVRRTIFEPAKIKELLASHQPGKRNLSGFIWILVIFEVWCRIFIDGEDYKQIKLF